MNVDLLSSWFDGYLMHVNGLYDVALVETLGNPWGLKLYKSYIQVVEHYFFF